jgi:hypothetical protein
MGQIADHDAVDAWQFEMWNGIATAKAWRSSIILQSM